jgi:hypothetical protein
MRPVTRASLALIVALSPTAAGAQVKWDLGAQGGVMKRVLNDRAGNADAEPGPYGEIHGHVALLPMIRVGAYGSFDRSPQGTIPARLVFGGGLRAKLTPPWPRDPWRAWVFLGAGVAFATAEGYESTATLGPPGGATSSYRVIVESSSGRFMEIPFGLGMSLTVARPLAVTLEVGNRFGLAHGGDLYGDGRAADAVGFQPIRIRPVGNDFYAISGSLGLTLEL